MEHSFFITSVFIFSAILIIASFNSKLLCATYLRTLPSLHISYVDLTFVILIILAFFKSSNFSDFSNIDSYELSASADLSFKTFLCYPIALLPLDTLAKLKLITIISLFTTLFAFRAFIARIKLPFLSFALLLYSLFPLLLFHYRQLVSFSILCLAFYLLTLRNTSPPLVCFLFALIFLAHPVYIIPYILYLLLLHFRIPLSKYNFSLILTYRKYIFPFLLVLIPAFLLLPYYFSNQLIPAIFSLLPSEYSVYSKWLISSPEGSFSLIFIKSFILFPFILPLYSSNQIAINSNYRVSSLNLRDTSLGSSVNIYIYSVFFIVILILAIEFIYGFYSFARIASSLYPFIVFAYPLSTFNQALSQKSPQVIFIFYSLFLSISLASKINSLFFP
jgi:hypothetical protein